MNSALGNAYRRRLQRLLLAFLHGLVLILCSVLPSNILAQVPVQLPQPRTLSDTSAAIRLGLVGGWGLNAHVARFNALPTLEKPFAPFGNSQSTGWMAAAEVQFPLQADRTLRLGLRADVQTLGAEFSADERIVIAVRPALGQPLVPRLVTVRHTIATEPLQLALTPFVQWNVWSRLWLGGGLRLGTLVRSPFEQRQTLIDAPPGVVFAGTDSLGRAVRIDGSGTRLPESTPLQIGLMAALRYEIPLGSPQQAAQTPSAFGRMTLTPELTLHYGLSNMVRFARPEDRWTTVSIRAGVALGFTAAASLLAPTVPTTPEHDTSKHTAQTALINDALRNDVLQDSTRASLIVNSVNNSALSDMVARAMRADTLYRRDTSVQIISWNAAAATVLLERSERKDLMARNGAEREVIIVSERYRRDVPKPRPVLAAALQVRFADAVPSGVERAEKPLPEVLPDRTDKTVVIRETSHAAKLSLETVLLRRYEVLTDTVLFDIRDTLTILHPPVMRLYPRVVSELGISSGEVTITQQYTDRRVECIERRTLARYSLERLLAEQRPTGSSTSLHTVAEWNERKGYLPDHWVIVKDSSPVQLVCAVNARDQGGQTAADSVIVHFDNALTHISTGNSLPPTPAAARVLPARSVLIATLALASDSVLQQRLDIHNAQVLEALRVEWEIGKRHTQSNVRFQSNAPPVSGKARSGVARSFVEPSSRLVVLLPVRTSVEHSAVQHDVRHYAWHDIQHYAQHYVQRILALLKIPPEAVTYAHSASSQAAPQTPPQSASKPPHVLVMPEPSVMTYATNDTCGVSSTTQAAVAAKAEPTTAQEIPSLLRIILERKLPKP